MVSLIITVKNEVINLPDWWRSIQKQVVQPDEIIIVDGGSNDGTWGLIKDLQASNASIKVFKEPGNIAHGRNFAIYKSSGDIIVVTDAGCIYNPSWLRSLIDPLQRKINVWSATAFSPWFEEGDKSLVYSIAACTIPKKNEFTKSWLPSSRSVSFYKKSFIAAGGYPEWIPFCEDVIFDLQMKKMNKEPFFVREPLVCWRPRLTVANYFKQLFNYTRSEGHGGLNIKRQIVRFTVYPLALILIYGTIAWSKICLVLLISGFLLYMIKFWRRTVEFTIKKNTTFRLCSIITVPILVLFGDVAKMSGYVYGIYEKKTNKLTV